MIGGNLPECDAFTLSLLTNAEYLKMHREATDAKELLRNERNGRGVIQWTANGNGCKYLALFNTDAKPRRIRADLTAILMPDTAYRVFDIWENAEAKPVKNTLTATVEPHGAKLFKLY